MATASDLRFRRMGHGAPGGVVMTIAVHAGLGVMIYLGHIRTPPPVEATRDLIVTQLVKFGKPRDKFWLPKIVEPPRPKAPAPTVKLSDNPEAPPAPQEAPRPENAEVSKDLRRALNRARALQAGEESDEGSATGSTEGGATSAAAGDAYATAVHAAISRNWSAPTGLVSDADLASLVTEVRLAIDADGTLLNPRLSKSSGNQFFDDSCVQAVKATGKVPPPPSELRSTYKRGLVLVFAGKDLAK